MWLSAGINPLRRVYYNYLECFHREPEDAYELLKGFSYIVITRG